MLSCLRFVLRRVCIAIDDLAPTTCIVYWFVCVCACMCGVLCVIYGCVHMDIFTSRPYTRTHRAGITQTWKEDTIAGKTTNLECRIMCYSESERKFRKVRYSVDNRVQQQFSSCDILWMIQNPSSSCHCLCGTEVWSLGRKKMFWETAEMMMSS